MNTAATDTLKIEISNPQPENPETKKTILFVENKELFANLAQSSIELLGDQFNFIAAPDGGTALDALRNNNISIIVTAIGLPDMDGLQLIEQAKQINSTIPVIVWTSNSSETTLEKLKKIGCAQIFAQKPQDLNELEDAIVRTLSVSQDDILKDLSLNDFVEKTRMQGKSCTLTVQGQDKTGTIYINNGLLVNALTDFHDGDSAALEIFSWKNPKITDQKDSCPDIEKKINDHTVSLLFDVRPAKTTPSAKPTAVPANNPLQDAIDLVKGHHLNEGKKALVDYVKKNPKNHEAWLWLSRCSQNLAEITQFLDKARTIAPEDNEVVKDTEKLSIAKEKISDEQIRRCPFCWSPISVKTFQCHYCLSYMFFHEKMTLPLSVGRAHIVRRAINDLNEVPQKDKNPNILYFLSLAYLHQENYAEAISFLRNAVNVAPKVMFLSNQLKILERIIPAGFTIKNDTSHQNKKILVVEDSITTRRFVVKTLQDSGYNTIEACDGLEALSKLNAETPDMILLDIILPKMDGYKVLSIIKSGGKKFENTPVIMLTSKDGMLNKLKGKMAGSSAYLTKPFDPKELIQTIDKHLQGS